MLTGRPLDDVIKTIGDAFDSENGLRYDHRALSRLGFADGSFIDLNRPFCITPQYFRRYAWRRKALLTVPSLNIPNGWHMVYTDGSDIFDPSSLKTYTAWNQLMPDEIILFDESGLPPTPPQT